MSIYGVGVVLSNIEFKIKMIYLFLVRFYSLGGKERIRLYSLVWWMLWYKYVWGFGK